MVEALGSWMNPRSPVTTSFREVIYLETNIRTKHFTDSTRITTAGFTRQKLKQFHFPKPQWKPPDIEGSSHYVQQWQSHRSQLIQTGPRMRSAGDKAHSQHSWDVGRFWQGNKVFDRRGIKAWKVSASVEQSTRPSLTCGHSWICC